MKKNCEGEGALIANRRDGGECRASQRLATGTRGSGQSHGSCARNGLQCQPGAELGAVEMQGRKAPRGRDTKKARDAPQHGLEARSNGRSRDRNRCTGTGWAPSAKSQQLLFERETEHLCLRQLTHGIGEGPRSPARETVTPLTSCYPTPDHPMPDVYWGRGGSELT